METAKKKYAWLSALSYAGLTLLVLATVLPLLPPSAFKWLRKAQHTPPIKQVLANAHRVYVTASGENGPFGFSVSLSPDTKVESPRRSSALFWSLKRTSRFNAAPPRTKPDMKVLVYYKRTGPIKWLESGKTYYQYVSTTGELGRGDEWCVVPAELRVWIHQQYLMMTKPPPARTPPVASVQAKSPGLHVFNLWGGKPYPGASRNPYERRYEPYACDVEYWLEPESRTRHDQMGFMNLTRQWLYGYEGRTVTYRFRWKYRDGTTGPWSKPVSAKILP